MSVVAPTPTPDTSRARGSRWAPAALALCAVVMAFAWQAATVTSNYAGNWSALYCTGALRGVPASLASEHIYEFPGSNGYDGQLYHYIAHDPLLRDRQLVSSVDEPRLRYRRIFVPALAFLLAGGRAGCVDRAYFALILFFIGLGVYWTSCWCRDRGRSPAWGFLFLALPAVPVSIDRMVTDVALAAFAAGLALYWRVSPKRSFIILICAALVRETGFLLLAGYCGWLLLERRFTRAALFSLAGVPAFAWYGYVQLHTRAYDYHTSLVPLSGIWNAFVHPAGYPPAVTLAWLARAGDLLALSGVVIAFALSIRWLRAGRLSALTLSGLFFTALGVLLQRTDHWMNVYDFGRVYSPLLLYLVLDGLDTGRWTALLPVAMMEPRVLMQFGKQVQGIVTALRAG